MKIDGPSFIPPSPTSVVVFFHGYGSSGDDLFSIADVWRNNLPETAFISPHGIETSDVNPFGYQWFGLVDFDPYDIQSISIQSGLQKVRPILIDFLTGLSQKLSVPLSQLFIVGFSQGAMIAMDLGFHLNLGGIIAYSGIFYPLQPKLTQGYPPLLVVHGQLDTLVPYAMHAINLHHLERLGIQFESLTSPLLAHGIDAQGIHKGLRFIQKHLPVEKPIHPQP